MENSIEDAIKKAVALAIREELGNLAIPQPEAKVEAKGAKIAGIRGLANYLSISAATAQKLKNLRKVPYMAVGNRLFFFTNEVDAALAMEGGCR